MTPTAPLRVAFQGERGAYSEEAARKAFPGAQMLPFPRFSDAFEAVVSFAADRAVIPVENSQAGSITETYDLLLSHGLHIVGEVDLRVRHCLLALPGQTLQSIREAHSHPQALAQTEVFLRAHGLTPRVEYDTAGAAKRLAELRLTGAAAVASRVAAEIYGLTILAEGIETHPDNRTRFVVLSTAPVERVDPCKTSLVLVLKNVAGSLHLALGSFANRGLNLTKLESRPSRRAAWEYVFYVDVEGHLQDPPLAEAVRELAHHCEQVRVLGSYPRASASPFASSVAPSGA